MESNTHILGLIVPCRVRVASLLAQAAAAACGVVPAAEAAAAARLSCVRLEARCPLAVRLAVHAIIRRPPRSLAVAAGRQNRMVKLAGLALVRQWAGGLG